MPALENQLKSSLLACKLSLPIQLYMNTSTPPQHLPTECGSTKIWIVSQEHPGSSIHAGNYTSTTQLAIPPSPDMH